MSEMKMNGERVLLAMSRIRELFKTTYGDLSPADVCFCLGQLAWEYHQAFEAFTNAAYGEDE